MKILINSVAEKFEFIKEINSLQELKRICLEHRLTLIEAYDEEHIKSLGELINEYEIKRFKGCELILTKRDDYIE